ncbi:hypothetical protein TTHERM_000218869 (macronuclear) [Tetrahymena thermophila SB210]|uniref:Uncharacterized protein n=1 Tax=Tetrahymena thermophila (strain SB210) TaxID=312017 RepID=W7XIG7_TETTS|nr:hypothetical protein TTHERM_000218869 [Tetrahymena thermophila SB210]EWS73279.1 hypothetical protein TTHERM_000218869 [Tetrahymena thermophila SB210]|eukprot:XP_012654188.1 hypothetical protein TTHERM_000218869 [Tetrahymena thermophila SB210]
MQNAIESLQRDPQSLLLLIFSPIANIKAIKNNRNTQQKYSLFALFVANLAILTTKRINAEINKQIDVAKLHFLNYKLLHSLYFSSSLQKIRNKIANAKIIEILQNKEQIADGLFFSYQFYIFFDSSQIIQSMVKGQTEFSPIQLLY